MTSASDHPAVLKIKKYPNRRYYDTTRSCHVTLQDVHALVLEGRDVSIVDSKTGEDITNLVLTQILLEKDQPKLDIFPTSVFHMMIRSNRQALRGSVERYFAPFMQMVAASQKQFDTYFKQAMRGEFVSPMEWASGVMSAMGGRSENGADSPPPDDGAIAEAEESVEDLRAQLADLESRLRRLDPASAPSGDV